MIKLIIQAICKYYSIDYSHFMKNHNRRNRELVLIRQLTWKFLDKYTKMTLFSMGAIFNKDHATCLVGIKTISNTIDTDRILRDEFKDIEKYVKRIIDGYNPLYRSDKMKSMSRKRRHQQTFKRKSIVS